MRSRARSLNPLARVFLSGAGREYSFSTVMRAHALQSKRRRFHAAYADGQLTLQCLLQQRPAPSFRPMSSPRTRAFHRMF